MGGVAGKITLHLNLKKIFQAIRNGDSEGLEKLIYKGIKPRGIFDRYGRTPLLSAIRYKNISIVKFLIDRGVDINEPDYHQTVIPINFAVQWGGLEITQFLIDAGADVNSCNPFKYTPLHTASSSGNYDIAKMLLEKGADVNAETIVPDYKYPEVKGLEGMEEELKAAAKAAEERHKKAGFHGDTPLHASIDGGNPEIVRALIKAGADVNLRGLGGYSPLSLAVQNGKNELVKILLDSGARIDEDDFSDSPLHDAVRTDNIELVKLLLNSGANPNVKNNHGSTPLHYCCYFNRVRPEIADILISKGADVQIKDGDGVGIPELLSAGLKPGMVGLVISRGYEIRNIFEAAIVGDIEKAEEFLKAEPEIVNSENFYKNTPLMLAARSNNLGMAKFLISRGAEPGRKSILGYTALHFAGSVEMAEYLISEGAEVTFDSPDTPALLSPLKPVEVMEYLVSRGAETKEFNGASSAVLEAVINDDAEMAEFLASKGMDVNREHKITGHTPLYWAASRGQEECVRKLTAAGANLETRDRIFGNTPLHIAAETGYSGIVKILIEAGADVRAVNKQKKTPLHLAAMGVMNNPRSKKTETMKHLIEAGADVNAKDETDRTPLDCAAAKIDDGAENFLRGMGEGNSV